MEQDDRQTLHEGDFLPVMTGGGLTSSPASCLYVISNNELGVGEWKFWEEGGRKRKRKRRIFCASHFEGSHYSILFWMLDMHHSDLLLGKEKGRKFQPSGRTFLTVYSSPLFPLFPREEGVLYSVFIPGKDNMVECAFHTGGGKDFPMPVTMSGLG